jgi:hypothetical protein
MPFLEASLAVKKGILEVGQAGENISNSEGCVFYFSSVRRMEFFDVKKRCVRLGV